MKKEMVNWGVMGCADIAEKALIPGILKANNAKFYAISGRRTSKLKHFAKAFHPEKVYDSYEALLEDPKVDAVYIPLPNALHCEWTIKAAKKKKHVLCEKPLALSEEQVLQMQKACDDNGVLLMEAFASRHNPVLKKVKFLIEDGVIGKLKHLEAHFAYLLEDANNVRLDGNMGGGATYDVGVYTIGTIRYLTGKEPLAIYTIGDVNHLQNIDKSSCMIMSFEEGITATSYCALDTYDWRGYVVIGEAGRIEVPVDYNDSGELPIKLFKNGEEQVIIINSPHNYQLEVEQFGRCIMEGEVPLVTFADSIGNAIVTDEALKQMGIRTSLSYGYNPLVKGLDTFSNMSNNRG